MSIRVAILDQATRGEPKRPVVNVILLDDLNQIPEGFDGIESDTASPGDLWDGATFARADDQQNGQGGING